MRFTADEFDAVREAAERHRMTPAGFVAAAALSRARPGDPSADLDSRERLDELRAARAHLARVGINLNQAARVLNSGGDAPELGAVLALVARAVARVEEAADRLRPG